MNPYRHDARANSIALESLVGLVLPVCGVLSDWAFEEYESDAERVAAAVEMALWLAVAVVLPPVVLVALRIDAILRRNVVRRRFGTDVYCFAVQWDHATRHAFLAEKGWMRIGTITAVATDRGIDFYSGVLRLSRLGPSMSEVTWVRRAVGTRLGQAVTVLRIDSPTRLLECMVAEQRPVPRLFEGDKRVQRRAAEIRSQVGLRAVSGSDGRRGA